MSAYPNEILFNELENRIKDINKEREALQATIDHKKQKLGAQYDILKKELLEAQDLLSSCQNHFKEFSDKNLDLSNVELLNDLKTKIEQAQKLIQEILNKVKNKFYVILYEILKNKIDKLMVERSNLKEKIHIKKKALGKEQYSDLKKDLSKAKGILLVSSKQFAEFSQSSLTREVLWGALETKIKEIAKEVQETLDKVKDHLKMLNSHTLRKHRLGMQKSMSEKSVKMMKMMKLMAKQPNDISPLVNQLDTLSKRLRSLSDKGNSKKESNDKPRQGLHLSNGERSNRQRMRAYTVTFSHSHPHSLSPLPQIPFSMNSVQLGDLSIEIPGSSAQKQEGKSPAKKP